ncbi:uncharacterized protein G2W53_018475 [Senna tora]|uniref:Uncharacterized protein n=1 Tax=Senna tora TaxID=362788 RepID=A0A834TV70_9FABA|nr:uncharacterized protein G2W53_018475 [Senna tora]
MHHFMGFLVSFCTIFLDSESQSSALFQRVLKPTEPNQFLHSSPSQPDQICSWIFIAFKCSFT